MRILLLISLLFGILNAQSRDDWPVENRNYSYLENLQNREALLIGNRNYSYLKNLQNPKPSMKNLKEALEKLGFHVVDRYDLDAENLSAEVYKFRDRLSSDTIGFFYYSGHGCQINNQSYLIPTNVDTRKASKVKYHALSIGELLDTLNRANNRVNMLFLDACRDVPIGARGGKKGLGQISTTPKGTLVVYATEAGKTANDNTLFINELRKTLLTPNKKLWEIGNSLSNSVANKTNDEQIPEMFSKKLPSRLVLLEGGYVPPPPPPPPSKWITPKNSVCRANGGKIDKSRVCKAKWKKAKQICSASGGRLPTLDELKRVVTDCGGEMNKYSKNENNSQYQNCYKEKGFSSDFYWSSTPLASYSNRAWIVYFYKGIQDDYSKYGNDYVRCVRAGE